MCIGSCEVTIGLGVVCISVVRPGGDLVDELVGYAAVEALGRSNAQFGLGEIEPAAVFWRVVPFEAFDTSTTIRRALRGE